MNEDLPTYRPNIPEMDNIEAALRDIAEMEAAIQEIKNRFPQMARELSEMLPPDNQINAARYLYYFVADFPSDAIADGFFGGLARNQLAAQLGSAPIDANCDRCRKELRVRSRNDLQKLNRRLRKRELYFGAYRLLCDECFAEVLAERQAESNRARTAYVQRLAELRAMSYRDYLQTDEWKARRAQHLKSAGYRCQVCNAKGLIDIHHRTYERRGDENYKDLIALCRNCHSLFHKEGKLARD